MKTKTVLLMIVLAAAVAWTASTAQAGELHPELAELLNQTPAGEAVAAIVVMREQTDLSDLRAEFRSSKTTRQYRHEMVVKRLQETSGEVNQGVLDFLSGKAAAKGVRAFWVMNAIAVTADAATLKALAARDDVAMVYADREIDLIAPVSEGPVWAGPKATAEVENGVMITGAPELWEMGIDGTGALVCDMDTGADSTHPAFADRWRGGDPGVTWQEAWFYPKGGSEVPIDTGSHGTHTMGTILGREGDHTIGMAPGAKWIAAAVIDVPGRNTETDALATMEWTTDPDGNPATVDDVPDVTNNSWGIPRTNCEELFWDAIDNAEAAGTVYVWAAGNEGPLGRSLRSPADRTETDVNTFAVGALKQNTTQIASFSSRGPSDCPGAETKPEVCAVGEDVLSSIPGGGYSTKSGTSMAAPHVTGAVALLRAAHPDATVEEIKYALYNNTVDLGDPGEDNTYGTGRIDVVAALGDLGFVDRGGIKGAITVRETGDPIPGAEVNIEGVDIQTESATDGTYRVMIVDEGTYTVTVTHPDYGTFEKEAVVAIGPWTVVDFDLSNIPVADFESDKTEICQGESVQFTSNSQGLITAYIWGFSDGTTAFEADPLLTFSVPGSILASLYVGGPTGDDKMDVPDYLMVYQPPAASFDASTTQATAGKEIQFSDTSAGPAASWLWDFGDGQTSEEQNPAHAYEEEGVYSVSLTVTNLCGENAVTQDGLITVLGGSDDDDDDAGDDDDDDDDGCGC